MSGPTDPVVGGNVFDKYRSTNPLYRRIVNGFVEQVASVLRRAAPRSVLDVGCADGELARTVFARCDQEWLAELRYVGLDVAPSQIAKAKELSPLGEFVCADAASIPYDDATFDLVLGLEVLEHVVNPALVLSEISRVARKGVVISVPWEPLWRILNVCRLKYLSDLGNTPGHLQHFSRRDIRKLFARHCTLEQELNPFPWTMLAGRPVRSATEPPVSTTKSHFLATPHDPILDDNDFHIGGTGAQHARKSARNRSAVGDRTGPQ